MQENDHQPTNPPEQPATEQPRQPLPPQQQQPAGYSVENPGQTLGIISIILPFVGFSVVGIVLGAISRSKSKQAGMSTSLGTVGLIISIIVTVLATLITTLWIVLVIAAASYSNGFETEITPYTQDDSSIQREESDFPTEEPDTEPGEAEVLLDPELEQ